MYLEAKLINREKVTFTLFIHERKNHQYISKSAYYLESLQIIIFFFCINRNFNINLKEQRIQSNLRRLLNCKIAIR